MAYTQTKTGAIATALGFLKELEHMQATGDNQYFQSAAALDTCVECKRLSDGAVSAYKAGGYAVVGAVEASNGKVIDSMPDLVRIQVDVKWPGTTAYFPAERIVQKFSDYIGPVTVDVQWIEGQWIVVYFALLGAE